MKTNPIFSIAIPAYKDLYLKDCLESVLRQTYKDFEIIVVNDSSPYNLDSIINEFKDERIRYYKNQHNCGAIDVVDNWNKCLDYAKGDYILCMGDDDLLDEDCLKNYANLINKYPCLGVYHTWTQIIDENGNFVNITESRPEYESVYSMIWHRWDNRKQQFIGDFLFDTKLLRNNGGFYKLPLAWASDDISSIIAASYKGVANTQKLGFSYRKNSHTISNTGNIDIKMKAITMEEKWFEKFLSSEPIDHTDKLFWHCIKNMEYLHFEKKRALTIAADLKVHSIFRIFYWIIRKKKYKLTNKSLIYSIIQSRK